MSNEIAGSLVTETQYAEAEAPRALSLLESLLEEGNISPARSDYQVVRRGIEHLLSEMLAPTRMGETIDKVLVDVMIAELDSRLSAQINAILHHPTLQALESAWRGLQFAIERIDSRENTKVEMMNISKEDLLADFEDSPEVPKSGLYRWVYNEEYGSFGGQPYGLICGNYEFDTGHQDLSLLQKIASVCAMAHAPFVAAASPKAFGLDGWDQLPEIKDLRALFEGPQYTRWHAFRESEDARYIGLSLPRFVLRKPYGANTLPVKAFNFEEKLGERADDFLWGNASFAFATRVADSFAKYRWCPNIIGPASGGTVEEMPLHNYAAMNLIQFKQPTEAQITERREFELSEEGFIPLTYRKDTDNACFFSANSVQKPKTYGNSPEGKAAETNYRLGTQLPYMFIMTRIAHYLKVLQREQLGGFKERSDLERELNQWINQYVADLDDPAPGVRARRPIRRASIKVEDVEGQAGWYRISVQVRPHFKYMGAQFTLSLVGKLDKEFKD
ncbi:MAG: type VI secretion system contractile sheath large subunit [Myxococcales bacterium]|nr:type VI secretion system contractile sheath large subunit [Myxococcales bacterium]